MQRLHSFKRSNRGKNQTPKGLRDAPERGRELPGSALSHRRSSFGCCQQPALMCTPVPPARCGGESSGEPEGGAQPISPHCSADFKG